MQQGSERDISPAKHMLRLFNMGQEVMNLASGRGEGPQHCRICARPMCRMQHVPLDTATMHKGGERDLSAARCLS